MYDEEPLHQWYCPETRKNYPITSQYRDNTPMPARNVAWSKYTKTPVDNQTKQSARFQLGMDLMYRKTNGMIVPVVYEGDSANGLLHTACFKDGAKLTVHDRNLQLLDQTNFSNMPKTRRKYRNKVGTGLSLEEAQALARPLTISPLQQQLMSWYHQLYHLTYRTLFRLASIGFLTNRLLECRNKTPLCVAC